MFQNECFLYDLQGNYVKVSEVSEGNKFRSFPLPPPFPLKLLNDLDELSTKILRYLNKNFLSKSRNEGLDEHHRSSAIKCRFRRQSPPSILIEDYIARIRYYLTALEPTMLIALIIYAHRLDPLAKTCPEFGVLKIDDCTVHRFIITGLCLASKAMGDYYYSNLYYAKVGGISVSELNGLESDLTERLKWRLQCSREELAKFWSLLENCEASDSEGITKFTSL